MRKRQVATVERERVIINHLKDNPSSIKGLEGLTGYNYYTIRTIVADLVERGILTVSNVVDKHRIYAFNADNSEQHEYIPRLISNINKTTSKAIGLIGFIGVETAATRAVNKLGAHMAWLMDTANDSRLGSDVTVRLNNQREDMQKDYIYLQNILSYYEQILKEPRFWNEKFLQEMPNDPDYNYEEIKKALKLYQEITHA